MLYDTTPYVNAKQSSSGIQSGTIVVTRWETDGSQANQCSQASQCPATTIDTNDPLVVAVNAPSNLGSSSKTLVDDSMSCMKVTEGQMTLAEFSVPVGRSMTLTGRIGEEPTKNVFEFSFRVTSSQLKVTHPHDDVKVFLTNDVVRLFVTRTSYSGQGVCVRVTYTGIAAWLDNRCPLQFLSGAESVDFCPCQQAPTLIRSSQYIMHA